MRNAHEQRLTIIQSKMTQLSAEHAALLHRVKDEGAQRAADAEAKVRREVERAALTAGINLRSEMDAKLNRVKTKYRVEVRRLRRMLERVSRLDGAGGSDDAGAEEDINYSKHEDVDASVGGLTGYDEKDDEAFRMAGVSTDDSLSSGGEVKLSSATSSPKPLLVGETTMRREERAVANEPFLGARAALLNGEKKGLPGLERSGIDLINDSGLSLATANMSANTSSRMSSPATSPVRMDADAVVSTRFVGIRSFVLHMPPTPFPHRADL